MTTASHSPRASSAEKRALWEVRQRYQLQNNRVRGNPPPPSRPTVTAPHSGRRGGWGGWSRWIKRTILFLLVLIVLGGGVFGYKILAASNKISVADRSLLGQLKDLFLRSGQNLKGEQDGRVNVLLIAIGGEGHAGRDLADTIMIASIRPQDKKVALVSIPRDLYVQVPGQQFYSKINAVHAYGESQKKDYGPELLRKKVEEITGIPLHYYARVDFTAFKNIVDAVGGVNITIPNSFFDYWHKISFPAGTEKMNGERALAYVRARYIEGPEGGDFKRTARQQQVLLAIRDKAFSVHTAFDFARINSILNSLSDNIRTDMQLWEMKRFYELSRQINAGQIRSVVFNTGPNGVLVGGTEVLGGVPASVLRTRTGDYTEIQNIVQNVFSDEHAKLINDTSQANQGPPELPPDFTPTPSPSPSETPLQEKPTVEIRNGTTIAGLAKTVGDNLKTKGYDVTSVGNAHNRATTKTVVYAIQPAAIEGAKQLAGILGALSDSGLPKGEGKSTAQVLIIVGQDIPASQSGTKP